MAEVLEFHRSLYDPDAVEAAVAALGHLATVAVDRREHHTVVTVDRIDERVADRFTDALCNHALFETVSRARARETA